MTVPRSTPVRHRDAPRRVTVVGGGVAGLSVAYFLARGGADVTVFERGRAGSGASAGNAGWLTPAQAGPLPEPGLAAYGLRSLVQPDAPLYFAPAYLPRMLGWLARFAAHCNARDHRRSMEALAQLGGRTFELIAALQDDGVAFEVRRDGFLLAAEHEEHVTRFLGGLAPLRALGYEIPERPLAGPEVRDLEPLLSPAVGAGALIAEHWHVDPLTVVTALAHRLREIGVTIHEGAEVVDLREEREGWIVRTSLDESRTDAVVIAAGAWTPVLTRALAAPLPIEAGKGYSFEVRLDPMPHRSFELLDAHVGCTPLGARVRVAGTMEFSGVNARLDDRRIAAIVRSASRLLPALEAASLERRWCGLRPIAPDGLPVIDRLPGRGHAYVAGAYSMLGMTIAAPAGEALARLVLTGRRPPELEPFRADRFRRLRPRRA